MLGDSAPDVEGEGHSHTAPRMKIYGNCYWNGRSWLAGTGRVGEWDGDTRRRVSMAPPVVAFYQPRARP